MRNTLFSVVIAMATLPMISHAAISVTPMIVTFKSSEMPRQDVMVFNRGKHTAYVTITPYQILNPGSKHRTKIRIHDPGKSGLLVTPHNLVISPGGVQRARLILTKPHDQTEHIYQIVFAPLSGKLVPGKTNTLPKKVEVGVHIILAYGVMAFVEPINIHKKLIVTRHGKTLVVRNTGNVSIILAGGKQCKRHRCHTIKAHRLYAGNTWRVKLPYNTPVQLTQFVDGKKIPLRVS